MLKTHALFCAIICYTTIINPAFSATTVEEVSEIAPVWSGHPVRFALLTHGNRQFVAFYDAKRRMCVAARELDEDKWQIERLPSQVGWDSHNYITMAVDANECLHLSGNMHCVPLIYFRTAKPLDIASFEKIPAMVGKEEKRCTYPRFIRGPGDKLIFVYRSGSSGNGSRYFNIYDPKTRKWKRLFDKPLFDGQGRRNAYFVGPVQDKKGMYHICWVWRDTPDCSTNHHLSYVRSKDLINWEKSDGSRIELPITIENAEIIDPVPPGGGLLNGNTKIGFDAQDRVTIGYHKYDAEGNLQIYNARRENSGWKIYQTTDWNSRWPFSGGGSIGFQVRLSPVQLDSDGNLVQSFRNPKEKSGNWRLDPVNLKPIARAAGLNHTPREIHKPESRHPDIKVLTAGDIGKAPQPDTRYIIRWETLPPNRDRPYKGKIPKPNMLRVYKLKDTNG
ncbi:MAG: BNR repeat-containing protein [Pirellulales bacterium]|nr:BNR repeat-containing protein [Pirellulales bacterium]